MSEVNINRKPEDVTRLAKYLLFKYAPITHAVLGFAEFVFDDTYWPDDGFTSTLSADSNNLAGATLNAKKTDSDR